MNPRTLALLAATVLLGLSLWPILGALRAPAVSATPAAVLPDYLYRNKTIAFYEKRVVRDREDQISARTLAAQYLQRYRETGDLGDIFRAQAQARRSIKLQPRNNFASYELLGSAATALHRFKEALRDERYAASQRPDDSNAFAQIASIQMELGDYAAAEATLSRAEPLFRGDASLLSVRARYDEMTGKLASARALIDDAMQIEDAVIDNPAQSRAWFHFRAGEMAFSAGDLQAAQTDEREALAIFPAYAQADNALARFCWAAKDWACALDAARKGSTIVPLPETLGYQADAQRALGDANEAAQTQDLIYAIERLGNAYHVNDRLLAVYYSDHKLKPDDAFAIAQREVSVRGNEIVAQDTLAWAAAMDSRWEVARAAITKATAYHTEDPRIEFHAGMIALHFGDRVAAKEHLQRALALNSAFHPAFADEARQTLASL